MDGADWLRTQLTSFGCAGCGRPFETDGIRVLAEREGLFFVDLGCACCGSQAVAIVTLQEEVAATPDFDDLVPAGRAAGPSDPRPPVSADDVLDVHGLLAGWDGDVHGLLQRLDGTPGPARP